MCYMGTQHSPQFLVHVYCGQMAGCIQMPLGTEVGLGPGHIALDGDPAHPLQKRDKAPKILAHVYCGKTAGWIKMTLCMGVGLGSGHIVLNGNPAPSSKGHNPPPDFRPMSVVPNGWMDQDATLYEGMPRPRPHCVTWAHSLLSLKKGHSPQFSAHICCGQMAGWINMPHGTEVGLCPSDITLDGDPVPPLEKGGTVPPNFRPMCVVAKRLHG